MAKLNVKETKLLAIWALRRMGVSFRDIGQLLDHSHNTIADYYEKACEEINNGKLAISLYKWSGKSKREVYVGDSTDVENLYARKYQRLTGGGWQTPKLSESDDV